MNVIRKILLRLYRYRNPIRYAKEIGVNIGGNCKIVRTPAWGSEPWLITIGDHVEISFDCAFITHDGATWTIRDEEKYKNVIKFGKIRIGNDCFIGARSTILPNVKIGNKSIIAAGSLVNKDVPAGEVWGGVPAKYIMSVDEYAKRCLEQMPEYDELNLRKNKKEEILRILSE